MNLNILTSAWDNGYQRYKVMRRLIAKGAHPLHEPFLREPSNPSSAFNTMEQLCQYLQMEDRYKSLVRSVTAREARMAAKATGTQGYTDLQRQQNAARQQRYRERRAAKLAAIRTAELK